jgi:transcriptional regulatory protein RtcR
MIARRMARKKPLVVIGLLGPTLDIGAKEARWERWRPSVALCQHPDLLVARFELLHQPAFTTLARTVQRDIGAVSPETAVQLRTMDWQDPWDLEEVYAVLHDFARSYPFDPEREDYLVHITTGTHVAQICLFLLTESRHFPARLLQTSPPSRDARGASPGDVVGTWRAIDLDLSRYDRLATRFALEARERTGLLKAGIETRNAAFNALIDRVERVALASTAPILLTGPTGAGKTQLARRIYELKRARRQVSGAFVEVNCATLRGDATMATLFGHAKGAFTGAVGEREGLLRQADGGVAFLDEIGDLGLDEQAMLLRAIEDKTFRPMGSDREVKSDFQLLAGTHRDLAARVAEGRFREDLLARIELWTFRLPGLRERPEDVEPNLEYELEQCARRLGVRVTFNREARERFVAFAASPEALWSGNFRDFSAAITRLATLSHGGRVDMAAVEEEIARLRVRWQVAAPAVAPTLVTPGARPVRAERDDDGLLREVLGDAGAEALDRFDRPQLAEVIRVCRAAPTLSAAGRELFARSRADKTSVNDSDRLRKYLARLGLSWERVARRSDDG